MKRKKRIVLGLVLLMLAGGFGCGMAEKAPETAESGSGVKTPGSKETVIETTKETAEETETTKKAAGETGEAAETAEEAPTKEAATETEETKTEAAQDIPADYGLYREILRENYGAEGNSDYSTYFLKDLDGNGVYEMVLECGGDGAPERIEVYTIENGSTKLVETIDGWVSGYEDADTKIGTIDDLRVEEYMQ